MYKITLPMVFPVCALVSADIIAEIATLLLGTDVTTQAGTHCLAGSSFAVTSDVTQRNTRWLYLSQASHSRVLESARWPDVQWLACSGLRPSE